MLMRWEDLEPGDVIKITDEAKNKWSENWLAKFIDKRLIVEDIRLYPDWVYVYFYIYGQEEKNLIYIRRNTGKWEDVVIFELMELSN